MYNTHDLFHSKDKPVTHPSAPLLQHNNYSEALPFEDPLRDMQEAHSMGTSIMAVEFDGGVVIGADSRTTTGSYIANRVSDKLTPVHDRIYVCRSGSAADTQQISDYVRYFLKIHSVEVGTLPLVETAANLFKDFCYNYKDQLLAGIICAGWDEKNGGSVWTIPLGGTLIREPFSIGGSGSTYIYGYCDANFKKGMTKDECKQFVRNALSLAMARDGSSGGVVRLAVITKDGVEREVHHEGPGGTLPKHYSD
ncbi:hypothetical protein FDP41_001036 [Naegleria fowleri]|uniref:Proteasome subunit beta n=1 Tax=Naegleria fowleri TaxID=5763 RepID=A0A6A5BPD8_NAEFO|nr:uncharacterized protein FDP41_001036 [Naegleria fowleri]KAF0979883.1 hypothetical protein FDP41_001036 [Naegleria fowleri]CAG4714676.1 unnamed protein product [Naegleria fowleri]